MIKIILFQNKQAKSDDILLHEIRRKVHHDRHVPSASIADSSPNSPSTDVVVKKITYHDL